MQKFVSPISSRLDALEMLIRYYRSLCEHGIRPVDIKQNNGEFR